MQAKSVIAALFVLATATSAFAQSAAPAANGTQLTRADVTAEYIRARNAGEIAATSAAYPVTPAPATASTVTREQVMAEFYAARKAGQIPQTEADFDIAQTRHHVVK